MVEYENDFVNEDLIEFEIEGKKFKYKPTTADDELTWSDEYLEIVDGKPRQNFKKLTLCKIRNLKEAPYGKETIKKIIGVEKDWSELENKQRVELLGKLKPSFFDKIVKSINRIDSPNNEEKKN